MRSVSLVLVDERSGGVLRLDVVRRAPGVVRTGRGRCPGQDHEIGVAIVRCTGDAIGTLVVQRIVLLQRDEDRTAAALGDQVEAMIKKLAEKSEPGVERGRKPLVRRLVGQL